MEQPQSLTAQMSHLTELTATVLQWLLSDVYMDIVTSKIDSLPYIKDGISGFKPRIYIKRATLLDDSYDDCDNKMIKDFFN